jgi:hypothetical protein
LAIAIVTSFQPGSYQITFRMKIPEKTTNEGIAQIYAGDAQGGDWKHIAGVTVSSNDFTAVDTYQDFTFEFELEKSVSKAEIRMDYLGTSTALVVDTVEVKNVDPVMPVFALIRVDWNGDVSQKPGQFGKGFEEGGGVFLTVEEFMASLNPEFMIEFAEPLVGSDHPLLIRAKEQFARGQYYESLISVRLALRDVDQ